MSSPVQNAPNITDSLRTKACLQLTCQPIFSSSGYYIEKIITMLMPIERAMKIFLSPNGQNSVPNEPILIGQKLKCGKLNSWWLTKPISEIRKNGACPTNMRKTVAVPKFSLYYVVTICTQMLYVSLNIMKRIH